MLKKAKNNTKKMEKHGGQLVWDKLGLKLSVLPPRSTLGTHNTLSTVLGLHCKFFKFVLHWVCTVQGLHKAVRLHHSAQHLPQCRED